MKLATSKNKLYHSLQIALGLFLGLPILYLITSSIFSVPGTQHYDYLTKIIPKHLANSLGLTFWTILFSSIISVVMSSTIALTDIKFKNQIKTLVYIPLAIPLYVASFSFESMVNYSSPFATFLRSHEIDITKIIHFDSAIQVGLIFSLYLSPYLTIGLIKAMESVGGSQWPVGRTLGLSTRQVLKKILLPSCLPWYIGGCIIIAMETLSDFGGVSAFNYDTLTTSIYTAWTGLFSLSLAIKISFILLIITTILFFLEAKIQKQKKFSTLGPTFMAHPPIHLNTTWNVILSIPILLYIISSIFLPLLELYNITAVNEWRSLDSFFDLITGSLLAAFVGAIIIIIFATIHVFTYQKKLGILTTVTKRLGLFGYSLPGPIVAIAIIGALAFFRSHMSSIPTSGFLILGLALASRFLYIGVSNLNSTLKRIPDEIKNTSHVYFGSRIKRWNNLYWPFLKKTYPAVFMFLFIEIIKELPITLILKPFGFNTLAVKIYELTSEGEWGQAAQLSIILLLLIIPISIIINQKFKKGDS